MRQAPDYASRCAAIPQQYAHLFPELADIDASTFPPTMFIHGLKDGLIDVEESRVMSRKLQKAGVDTVLHEVEGADHGFDMFMQHSAEHQALQTMIPFLVKYV